MHIKKQQPYADSGRQQERQRIKPRTLTPSADARTAGPLLTNTIKSQTNRNFVEFVTRELSAPVSALVYV